MLIEVMVGAVILAIAAMAILNGLDGAQATGARNKARSVAAALAEQDQERMRSMKISQLAGYSNTRTVQVRGVDYTVKSTGSWAPDSGAIVTCSNSSKTAANVRIVSEVSSPKTDGKVTLASLVAPPPGTYATGEGRAVVKVLDQSQSPLSGVTVTLSGPASFSGTTTSQGCVVFNFIPVGDYTASASGLGLVDYQGNTPATAPTSVTQSSSTLTTLLMGTAATIKANFDTKVGSATAVTSKSQWASVANSNLTLGWKSFEATPTGAPNTLVTASSLFPFTNGYGVYAGKCTANNPANAPTANGSYLSYYTPAPGQTLTTSPKVRTPAINIRVLNAAGTAVQNGATVTVKTADSGCSTTYPSQVSAATTSGGGGSLPEPGYPYGSYTLCAQNSTGTAHGRADVRTALGYDSRHNSTAQPETASNRIDDVVLNTNPNGTPALSANPVYPASPVQPGSTGSIIIRLDRTGPCT